MLPVGSLFVRSLRVAYAPRTLTQEPVWPVGPVTPCGPVGPTGPVGPVGAIVETVLKPAPVYRPTALVVLLTQISPTCGDPG